MPPPPPVEIIEHRIYKGWCSQCQHWQKTDPQLATETVKGSRFGSRIARLISYLRLVLRLPIGLIQKYLASIHQLKISSGSIVGLLQKVAAKLKPSLNLLQQSIRGSPVVHTDETGWREEGQNGYVWLMTTPTGLSYYEYAHSRSGEVARRLLGRNFAGVLVTDFYAGYNDCGQTHQRCWVHLLRDLEDLREEQAANEAVVG